eukprot:COSAG02_NODE_299_length_25349_cov_53.762020_18_plen_104_part_00
MIYSTLRRRAICCGCACCACRAGSGARALLVETSTHDSNDASESSTGTLVAGIIFDVATLDLVRSYVPTDADAPGCVRRGACVHARRARAMCHAFIEVPRIEV